MEKQKKNQTVTDTEPKKLRKTTMTVVIGTNGTGKTTLLKKIVAGFLKNKRRVLILTPHDREWENVPLVSSRFPTRIEWYAGARRMIYNKGSLELIIENFRNGVLIMDDCRAYIKAGLDETLHSLLIGRRQMDIDIFAVGHGFTEIPPKFFTFATTYILFRTTDVIERRRPYIMNYEAVEAAQKAVNQLALTNPYANRIINIQ